MATYQYKTKELKEKLNKIVAATENTLKIISEEHANLLPVVIEQRNELREKIKSVVDQVDKVVKKRGDEYTEEWIEWSKRTITKLFVKEPTKYKRNTSPISVDWWYSCNKVEELSEPLRELENTYNCWIHTVWGWYPNLDVVGERYIDKIEVDVRCHICFLPPKTEEFERVLDLDNKINEFTSSLIIVKGVLSGMNGSDTIHLTQHEAECIEKLSNI